MPAISHRARNDLDRLLAGEKLTADRTDVALPEDELSTPVLRELVRRYQSDELAVSQGAAERLIEQVGPADSADGGNGSLSTALEVPSAADAPGWRLYKLAAHNFRGLTEWEGEVFEYDFMGLPHHIYGLNGSGKTAILSAIVWCLTGYSLRERAEPAHEMRPVGLYSDQAATQAINVEWPEAATVPHKLGPESLVKQEPHCWVEVELRDGDRVIWVKRTLANHGGESRLEVREGETEYSSLGELGISDTDCEVGLLMPGRVGALQFAPGSRFSENLMAVSGLDALRAIGDLARRTQTQVTRVSNNWQKEVDSLVEQAGVAVGEATSQETVGDDVRGLLAEVESTCNRQEDESDIAHRERLYLTQSEAVERKAEEEFEQIARAIGQADDETVAAELRSRDGRARIVEVLRDARHAIGRTPLDECAPFGSWLGLEADIHSVVEALREREQRLMRELEERYEVWVQDREAEGRLDVKIRAAHYLQHVGRFQDCPVCEQILPEPIRAELEELASKTSADEDSLRVYVETQLRECESALPEDLRAFGEEEPAAQVARMLESHVLAPTGQLGQLHERMKGEARAMVGRLPDYEWTAPIAPLARPDWDETFVKRVQPLAEQHTRAHRLCAVASWVQNHVEAAHRTAAQLVGNLTNELSRLETYGARYTAMVELAHRVRQASSQCEKARRLSERVGRAQRVRDVLVEAARLDEYANACLQVDIDDVAIDMQRFYGTLYPNDPIELAGLANRTSRRGVQPDYRCILQWSDQLFADADPVANAGRMRGLLWSYSFALFEKQRPALRLMCLDDPYTSLDDYAAQNMMTELLVKELGAEYQVLSTIQDRHHVDPTFARDPSQERFGVAHVLHRLPEQRRCRIVPGLEPLLHAICEWEQDPEKYRSVIQETRPYLERNLKLVAEYLLAGDHRSSDFGRLMAALIDASQHGTGATPLGVRMQAPLRNLLHRFGVDFGVAPPEVTTSDIIMHGLHHGGPDEDLATPHHARHVADRYRVWAKDFETLFERVDEELARATRSATLRADQLPAVDADALPVTRHRIPSRLVQIGHVAAEGEVALDALDAADRHEYSWPDVEFALVLTEVCAPVALAGQVGVFAPSATVKDGDLALMTGVDGSHLRRVFRQPLTNDDGHGWVGQSVNPLLRNTPPIVRREGDVVLRKLVGVVYTLGSEGRLAHAKGPGEVGPLPQPWPDPLPGINAQQVMSIAVRGDSAEPVALSGQYLLVRKAHDANDVPDNSLCCARLSDGAAVLKRLTRSAADIHRVLLQPINVSARYPIIEAALGPISKDAQAGVAHLPQVEDLWVVCGVLFAAPEDLDS